MGLCWRKRGRVRQCFSTVVRSTCASRGGHISSLIVYIVPLFRLVQCRWNVEMSLFCILVVVYWNAPSTRPCRAITQNVMMMKARRRRREFISTAKRDFTRWTEIVLRNSSHLLKRSMQVCCFRYTRQRIVLKCGAAVPTARAGTTFLMTSWRSKMSCDDHNGWRHKRIFSWRQPLADVIKSVFHDVSQWLTS
jgi:hypothetical protein